MAEQVHGDLSEPRAILYASDPADFVATRSALASAAREKGEAALAKRIAGLRKPTTAASIVNRQVLADPSVTERLEAVGDALRATQSSGDGIDRDRLRELSLQRRTLVQELSEAAIGAFGDGPGPAVRDEVVSTFDAAIADPEVAAALGRLTQAQQWSGFGAVSDAPALTVVRGGKSGRRTPSRAAGATPSAGSESASGRRKDTAADTRSDRKKTTRAATEPAATEPAVTEPAVTRTGRARRERELAAAETKLDAAEHDLSAALEAEQRAKDTVADLEQRIADLESELGTARKDVKSSRDAVRAARSRRREATSARDRAARRAAGTS